MYRNALLLTGLLTATATSVACAATEMAPGVDDPASAQARSAPLPDLGTVLAASYDPLNDGANASQGGSVHEHHHHDHARHEQAPKARSAAAQGAHAHDSAGVHDGAAATADGRAQPPSATRYTCPMHPKVVSDDPGSCPICGMDLVPAKPSKAEGSHEQAPEKAKAAP